jgi:hypothetical protein
MRSQKVTLEESIASLARETGASASFVEKVRALFLGRGIDLEDSSEPYAAALHDAFRRHATIRHRLDETRESLARLHSSISDLGETFSGQLSRLRALRDAVERGAPAKRRSVAVQVELHPLVRGENDRAYVPGPEELQ